MGHLVYANSSRYEFDDRTLAHLKVVMGMKLQNQQSFWLNWVTSASEGSGRMSLHITPANPLEFQFVSPHPASLNRIWLEVLAEFAHSPKGLIVLSEQDAENHRRQAQPIATTDASQ